MVQTMVAPSTENKQIRKLVQSIRQRRAFIAAHEAKLDALREELQGLLEASGDNYADDKGYARLIPESTRISFDSKSLDALIITQPDMYGCLAAYRKVSKLSTTIQVK